MIQQTKIFNVISLQRFCQTPEKHVPYFLYFFQTLSKFCKAWLFLELLPIFISLLEMKIYEEKLFFYQTVKCFTQNYLIFQKKNFFIDKNFPILWFTLENCCFWNVFLEPYPECLIGAKLIVCERWSKQIVSRPLFLNLTAR